MSLRRVTHLFALLVKRLLLFLHDALFHRRPRRPPDDLVLFVRMDAIGDFVLWADAARGFAAALPGRRLALVCNSVFAELASATGWFQTVVAVDRQRFCSLLSGYRRSVLRRIADLSAGTVFNPVYSRDFEAGDCLVRASGAQVRVGWNGDRANLPWILQVISNRWYTCLLEGEPGPMHEIDRNAEFLRNTVAPGFLPRLPSISPLVSTAVRFPGQYIVVVPGAGSPGRTWPAERMGAVASHIVRQTGMACLLLGTSAEADLCERVSSMVTGHVENWAGKTGPLEFARLIKGASLVLGNDSGAVHLAAAQGTPSVSVLGGGQFGRFQPWPFHQGGPAPESVWKEMSCFGCDWRCIYQRADRAPFRCVEEIAVEDVLRRVDSILAKLARKHSRR